MRCIVFDTETTGFSHAKGDRIVEIGAVELIKGVATGRSFHTYVNPQRRVPEEARKVHGLDNAFLADKPIFGSDAVIRPLLAFFGESTLIAHNAPFDIGFINAELQRVRFSPLKNPVIDTVMLSKKKYPGASASLDALCVRFGISLDERRRDGHGALLDARLLAQVYMELTGGLQQTLALREKKNTEEEIAALPEKTSSGKIETLRVFGSLSEAEAKAHSDICRHLKKPLWDELN